jgi:hypothetical protein
MSPKASEYARNEGKVWLRDWSAIHESEKWMKMTLEAFGFRKPESCR